MCGFHLFEDKSSGESDGRSWYWVYSLRRLCGALGDPDGAADDSHAMGLLEYPHYTRPPEFRGWRVPDVLISGDHARVARWRREQALLRTRRLRPDLLESANLSEADRKFLAKQDDSEAEQ